MKKAKYLLTISILTLFTGCLQDKKEENKFYGNVDIRTVTLSFRVGGKIENIPFDEGQKVKKGDLLAKLDDSIYKENLNEVLAQIEVAKANLEKLENGYRNEDIKMAEASLRQNEVVMNKSYTDLQRQLKLYNSHSISKQTYDDIKEVYDSSKAAYEYAKNNLEKLKHGYEKEDIKIAQAQLKALEAQKNLKEISLNDTNLYSPTNGTIITRAYEIGSIINATTPVLELAKEDEYWIRAYISEKFLGKIKKGISAKIYTDSNSKTYTGKVSFISSVAEFTPKNVETEELRSDLVYRFRIIVEDFDEGLKQGMPVTIKFDNLE